ncbi:MAG: hypothetical protein AAF702_05390 [Chloroflexota bacterium]
MVKQSRKQNRIWVVVVLLLLVIACYGYAKTSNSAYLARSQSTTPALYDPLTDSEVAETSRVIEEQAIINQVESAQASPREVLLLTQRLDAGKTAKDQDAPPRRSESYFYNYDTNVLRRVIVNLATDAVEEIDEIQSVQLPLIDAEINQALQIVYKDDTISQTIYEQYRAATGISLESLEALEHKVFVFKSDTMPDRVNDASRQCGLQRCAQVLLFTHDRIAFEVTPIVNLSTQEVIQLMWVD